MVSKKQFLKYLLLFLHFILSASLDIISMNQTFKEGDLLISRGAKFAFGFFSPGNSTKRYLGIWFYKVSKQSVVWVANRNNPVSSSLGILLINQYGNLVLYNDPNQEIPLWSANVSFEVTGSCMAQLLDSGNLVLVQGKSKRIVWQSFYHPTDTLLPGMRLGLNQKTGLEWTLNSWKSEDDPGTGDCTIKLNPRGLPQVFLYESSKPQWRASPWPWMQFSDVYSYSYVTNQEEMYLTIHIKDDSIILRVTVDSSGIIKWLRWHEIDGQWKVFWSTTGYEPKSPSDWHLRDPSEGCRRKRLGSSSVCRHGEGFVKVGHIKIPDTSVAALVGKNMSLTECEQECLMNCSCSYGCQLRFARSR